MNHHQPSSVALHNPMNAGRVIADIGRHAVKITQALNIAQPIARQCRRAELGAQNIADDGGDGITIATMGDGERQCTPQFATIV